MGGAWRITHEIVSNQEDLRKLLNKFAQTFEEIRALLNEVKADSVANKAAIDTAWAAIIADRDDSNIMLEGGELRINNLRDWERLDRVEGCVRLATDGTDTDKFTTGDFSAMIAGSRHQIIGPVDGVGQALTANHAIGNDGGDHYGMILFLANELGTIVTAVNTTPQLQVSKFAASMLAVTIPADEVPIGAAHFEIANNDTWTAQTESFDAVHASVDVFALESFQGKMGVLVEADAFAPDATPNATFDLGAGTVLMPDGLKNAYDLTGGYAFSLNDTINVAPAAGDNHWGGWLVLIDAADAVYTLKADGVVVQGDMDYNDQPAVQTALDLLKARIYAQSPGYQIIGEIIIQPNTNMGWAANTDDMDPAVDCQTVVFTAWEAEYNWNTNVYGAVGPVERFTDTGGVTASAPTVAEATSGDVAQRTQRTV